MKPPIAITSCPEFVLFPIFEEDNTLFETLHARAIGYFLKTDYPKNILPVLRENLKGGSPPMSTGVLASEGATDKRMLSIRAI